MKKYNVHFKIHTYADVEVEAENPQEAIEKAKEELNGENAGIYNEEIIENNEYVDEGEATEIE